MRFFKDLSLSAFTAGFVAVLVGFTSSVVIVFQAAQAFGATPAMIASWMWALGLGMGLASALPSLWLRKPVMVAWSTPGAAVLATAGAGHGMGEAVGAFIVCAALVTLAGATGWFERVMNRIPMAIASALLAGVLARFGLAGFAAAQTALPLVLLMLGTYLAGRRFVPRYAVPLTLLAAVAFTAARGELSWSAVHFSLAVPVFTMPVFTWQAAVSLALPLFVVTMASQNLPGVAAIRAAGYDLPISKLITLTGVATLVLAPFGGYALNLSAITAAICMGREAHEDPARRYAAAVSCGAIYVVIGLFGAAVTGLLTAFPKELVAAIAGLALLGTIGGGLAAALREEPYREAALITFLVTLSGVTVAGIGSAFWGVVAGAVALAVQRVGRAKTPADKDIAPACKIRLDARAGAPAAVSPADPAASLGTATSSNPSSPTRP
ncbi:benzoate/H(+) symporter BenE family transporter [Variovorax sp. PvP013]|uniref:benzoate/H(+) symporter BenE family transporter n=1 Tax=Variovorax sp. PvP013 TaxID=3156435 RepID=UPI003D232AD0